MKSCVCLFLCPRAGPSTWCPTCPQTDSEVKTMEMKTPRWLAGMMRSDTPWTPGLLNPDYSWLEWGWGDPRPWRSGRRGWTWRWRPSSWLTRVRRDYSWTLWTPNYSWLLATFSTVVNGCREERCVWTPLPQSPTGWWRSRGDLWPWIK